MNLLFDGVMLLLLALFQLAAGTVLAVDLPFLCLGLLIFSMRRGVIPAVFTAFAAGFLIDLAWGREFALMTVSLPLAVAPGAMMLPERPFRFIYSDYIAPGAVAVFILKFVQMISPLFSGEEWYYLVPGGLDLLPVTLIFSLILPFFVFSADRLTDKLGIRRIFIRTMFVALHSARR